LADLIDHLLEKEPLLRPRDAGEVAGRLRALGAGTSEGEPTLQKTPERRATPVPPPPAPPRPWGRLLLALALLVGIAAAVWVWRRPEPPLYVAVLAPRLDRQDEDSAFLAFSVRGSLQSGLTSFEGIFPKGTGEVDAVTGKPADVARAVAADEVLEPAIACDGGACRVAVSRLRGADGAALWSGSIEIPRSEPLTAARALAVLLRQAYSGRRERPGVPALQVTPADYTEYLTLLRAMTDRRHSLDGSELLDRLAAIRRRSPGFVEPYRLAATIQINEYTSMTRDPALADRALALLEEARKIAPGDPDVCYSSAYAAIQAGRLAQAETALTSFEERAPGDVRLLDLQAALAERRGKPAEALAFSRAAVERQPSWSRLYEHAKLARRQGKTAEARRNLEQLLARFPGNEWGRRLLATLELTSGDPARAAALYEELLAQSAEPDLLANLGLARMLLGDHRGAATALERAVAAEPGNYYFLLNLAQARQLEGRTADGEALCRQVLKLSEGDRAGGWQRLTVRAQALAQLGDRQAAALAAQEALGLAPQNGQTAFEAALVFAMTGDHNLALANARRASDLGFDASAWFRLPWFEPLRGDADFRRLAGL
jgi:tetratricopeptide (TPR) repeat protein